MEDLIKSHHQNLVKHPVYKELKDIESLRVFMQYHLFAVWDFMSLLKALQNKLTCTTIPWVPSEYSDEVVRFINEIVLGEESDLDQNGNAISHFNLYIKAMDEIGANHSLMSDFLKDFDISLLPNGIREFVSHHLDLSLNGKVQEVAGSFLFGREKLLPDLFEQIVQILKNEELECPTLIYYFERHIELDGDSHGPLAQKLLKEICGEDQSKWLLAHNAGIQSLQRREELWNHAQLAISKARLGDSPILH